MGSPSSSDNFYHLFIPQIRQILLTLWDPIGIGHLDFMQHEYDGYILRVLQLLNAPQTKPHNLQDYLHYIEIDDMNIEPNLHKIQHTSEALWNMSHAFN